MSAWRTHGPFAFWIVENHRPNLLVELGTHNGFSYLAFCQKISALGLPTRCFAVDSWQGDEHAGFYDNQVYEALKNHHDPRYGTFSRLLKTTFDEALNYFEDGSIDLLHIDGRHFYDDVKHDYETWTRKLSSRAIVLFHDTQVHERDFGVWKLWEEISAQFPSFEFLHGYGLGVLAYGNDPAVRELPIFSPSMTAEERRKIREGYSCLGDAVDLSRSIRRNEACPCGSDQKYKHCHGKDV